MARRAADVVFHLAAQADVRVSVADPVFDADVNLLGTLRVLEGARAAGTPRVVFAASGGTLYGEPDASELPLNESLPQRPLSPYGVSKKAAHRLPGRLPGAPHARVRGAGPGQRLRPPPGPPRRGRGGRDLRRAAAPRPAGDHLRRRRADPRLRLRRRRGRRVRPRCHQGRGSGLQHRHRTGDVGQHAVRGDGGPGRGGRRRSSTSRCGPASWRGTASTRPGPGSSWAGARGPSWVPARRPQSGSCGADWTSHGEL